MEDVGSLRAYVIERSFSLTSIIIDMKRLYNRVFKTKKLSLGSMHGPDPATSTSTFIRSLSATDIMSSIPGSDAIASAHVTAGVSVSVQLANCIFKC